MPGIIFFISSCYVTRRHGKHRIMRHAFPLVVLQALSQVSGCPFPPSRVEMAVKRKRPETADFFSGNVFYGKNRPERRKKKKRKYLCAAVISPPSVKLIGASKNPRFSSIHLGSGKAKMALLMMSLIEVPFPDVLGAFWPLPVADGTKTSLLYFEKDVWLTGLLLTCDGVCETVSEFDCTW